jgi:hypothetical protein
MLKDKIKKITKKKSLKLEDQNEKKLHIPPLL